MDPNSRYYGFAVLGVCFVVPWIFILVCLVLSRSYVAAEKKKLKKENRGLNQSNKLGADTGIFNMAQNLHMVIEFFTNKFCFVDFTCHFLQANELKVMGLVACLLVIYIIFMIPFVVREKEDQIYQVNFSMKSFVSNH
jgi:hypothetical protein